MISVAEVEQAIVAKVERRVDQKVSTTLEDALAPGAELYRTITDRVYDTLYERLVLEKERRG